MTNPPTPDLIRAVRAGCDAEDRHLCCHYPACHCPRFVRGIRAAFAEAAKPSEEMLAEGNSAIFGETPGKHRKHRRSAEVAWRAMMRRVLGDES